MNPSRIFVMAKNVFQEVIRDRILYIIGFYTLILAVGNRIIHEFTSTSGGKVFLDFGLSTMNVMGLIVVVFVGVGLVNKEIEKRTVLVLIAKPISRSEFITSKYLGLSAVIGVLLAAMTLIYLGFLQFTQTNYPLQSILISVLFLFLQLSLMITVAITISLITGSLLATTLTLTVYLMGTITQDLLKLGRLTHNSTVETFSQALYLILPNLSRLDFKNNAVYGLQALPDPITMITNAGYGFLYIIMVLTVANLIFSQREF